MIEQPLTLEQLDQRLKRLEAAQTMITRDNPPPGLPKGVLWADREAWRSEFRHIMDQLGIIGEPIGTEALRQQMAQLSLDPNEFSRGIIEMREE
jgi:hypothetical protein